MMPIPAAILALLVGVAGWYYLFYSQAAKRLDGSEETAINRRRIKLRRANSVLLLLLAVGFYVGFAAVDSRINPQTYLLVWLGVCLLVVMSVLLALIDLRLTAKIRRKPLK
jgi:drug/metabolite transporter (DMT)-like permease